MRSSKLLIFFLSLNAYGQGLVGGSIQQPTAGASTNPTITIANASSTGTTLNTLTKLTGAPSTAVISTAGDSGGAVGITTGGAGTTGSATITLMGRVSCAFDGATTAGDYVQISATVNGECTDAGATYPTSGQVIGRILTTNGGNGTYDIDLYPSEIKASAGGGGAGASLFSSVTTAGPNNTAAQTSVIGTVVGSTTIPANTFQNGTVLDTVIEGLYSLPSVADSITVRAKCGSTILAAVSLTPPAGALATGAFQMRLELTAQGSGAGGAIMSNALLEMSGQTPPQPTIWRTGNNAPISFDFTTACVFDFTAQWGGAQSGESFTATNAAAWIPGAPVTSVNGHTGAVTITPFIQTLTAPIAASFTAQNFNTGTGVVTTQVNNSTPVTSIFLEQADPNSTNQSVALDKAKLAATFTLTEGFAGAGIDGAPLEFLWLSDGGSPPNNIMFGFEGDGQFRILVFSNFGTSFVANPYNATGRGLLPGGPLMWLRVQETASNRIYSASPDGINFVQIFIESNTAHFTTSRYGFGVRMGGGGSINAGGMTMYSFAESNP